MKYIIAAFLFLTAFFAPVVPMLIAVGGFIFLDTITGIVKSIKLNGWKSVQSRRLARFASKNIVYSLSVISFYIVDYVLINEVLNSVFGFNFILTKCIALVLCSIEVKSIDENIEEIYGTGLWDAFQAIIIKIKSVSMDISSIRKNIIKK